MAQTSFAFDDLLALRPADASQWPACSSARLGVADADAGKVSLIAGVTDDLTGRVKAGELVNHVASQVGGKGGGRADMAQAGGPDGSKAQEAINVIETVLRSAG